MKKTVLLSLFVALFALSGAFANGSSEVRELAETWDTVTVTGSVSFEDWPHPEISSRNTTYELMVPRFPIDEMGIEPGDEVTVEGIIVDRPFGEASEDEVYLRVIRAVVDGEEYFVPYGGMAGPGYGCPRGDGFGGPRRGPGGGYSGPRQGRGGRW